MISVHTEGSFGYGSTSCSHTGKFVNERVRTCGEEKNFHFCKPMEDLNGICLECRKKVTYKQKGAECENCLSCLNQKYRSTFNKVWFCCSCCESKERDQLSEEIKLFLRYEDDIARTVKVDPEELLNAAYQLQHKLQFTLEKAKDKGKSAFLGNKINVDTGKNVMLGWYQKTTVTGTKPFLSLRASLH